MKVFSLFTAAEATGSTGQEVAGDMAEGELLLLLLLLLLWVTGAREAWTSPAEEGNEEN